MEWLPFTCVSIYGLAAMVWIFILAHHKKPKALLKGCNFLQALDYFSGLF